MAARHVRVQLQGLVPCWVRSAATELRWMSSLGFQVKGARSDRVGEHGGHVEGVGQVGVAWHVGREELEGQLGAGSAC